MKCKKCNKDSRVSMNYCPYCGDDLNEAKREFKIKEKRKNNIIIISTVAIVILMIIIRIVLVTQITNELYKDKDKDNTNLDDVIHSVCGDYNTIYTTEKLKNQGIYQSKGTGNVYYIYYNGESTGYYKSGRIYEMGVTKNEVVEEIFPESIYFYRQTKVQGVPSELKIALQAESEADLFEKYGEKFYQFIKKTNEEYKTDIELTIYFNEDLSGINSTYDKLFLYAGYNTNNVSQAYGMGREFYDYILYDGDPKEILSSIFENPNNYPSNARLALKRHRHFRMKITDGQTIEFDEFINKLKESYEGRF